MRIRIFLFVLLVNHVAFGQTVDSESGYLPPQGADSTMAIDSLGEKSKLLDASVEQQFESASTQLSQPVKTSSYIAIFPKHAPTAMTSHMNIDSLIEREVSQYQLAKLDLATPFEAKPIDVLKSDTSFATYADSIGIDQLLVWELRGQKSKLICELELLVRSDYSVTRHETIKLGIDRELNQQDIRKAVWQLLDQKPPTDLFPPKKVSPKGFFTTHRKLSALATVSTAVLIWYVIQNSDTDSPASGIGLPPEWPQN